MTGSQKCLAAPLGMAIIGVTPPALGGDGAPQAQGVLVGLRSPALARFVDPGLTRRTRARRRAADRSPSPCRPSSTQASASPSGSCSRKGSRRASAVTPWPRRAFRAGLDAMRLEMFADKSVLSDTVSCIKTPAGIEPAAIVKHMRQTLRHSHRHRARQDAHDDAARRTHGHHGEPALHPADAVRARDDAPRSRLQERGRRGRGRGPGDLRGLRGVIVVPDDFPSVFEGTPGPRAGQEAGRRRRSSPSAAPTSEQELIRRIGRARGRHQHPRPRALQRGASSPPAPRLKMVSVWGTGTDNVDLNAAGMRGVTICNTPGVNAFAVAEHALALMLAVARKITTLDAEMRKGKWPRELLTQLRRQDARRLRHGHDRRPRGGARQGHRHGRAGLVGPRRRGRASTKRARRPPPRTRSWPGRTSSACTCASVPRPAGFIGPKGTGPDEAHGHPRQHRSRRARGPRRAPGRAQASGRSWARGSTSSTRSRWPRTIRSSRCRTSSCSPHNAGQTPEVIRDGLLRAVENVEHFLKGKPRDVVVAPVR